MCVVHVLLFLDSSGGNPSSTSVLDEPEPIAIPLSCEGGEPPNFRWKGMSTLTDGLSEEQIQRQLISLQRVITNRDRPALQVLVKKSAEIDLTLPLRGVTALSLALYLR